MHRDALRRFNRGSGGRDGLVEIYLLQLHLIFFLLFVFDQQSYSANVKESLLFSDMYNSIKFFLRNLFLLVVNKIMQQFFLQKLLLGRALDYRAVYNLFESSKIFLG